MRGIVLSYSYASEASSEDVRKHSSILFTFKKCKRRKGCRSFFTVRMATEARGFLGANRGDLFSGKAV